MYERLTENEIQQMKNEIIRKKMALRKEVIKLIVAIRLNGNLDENKEYRKAKRKIRKIETKILDLKKVIYSATIIEEEPAEDEIDLNSWVEIQFDNQPRIERYKLVKYTRTNSIHKYISITSPIGQAIFKHRVNDRVYVKVNDNNGYYVIIKSIEKDNKTTNNS